MATVPKLKAVSVKCFELFNEHGVSFGLYKVKDRWRGFCELQSVSNEKAIAVVRAHEPNEMQQAINEIFGNSFGEERFDIEVFSATGELIEKVTATELRGKA